MQPLSSILAKVRGTVVLLIIGLSSLVHAAVLVPGALLKFVVPRGASRNRLRIGLSRIAESWIGVNNALLSLGGTTRWNVNLPEDMNHEGCYLVICNHQSWVDILVLQRIFNRRLPLLRFFLKRQLFWVPVLGLCWWALDFPFMHRASREALLRRPELRGRDLESARRACEIFRDVPVAMMSFPEGTRRAGSKLTRKSAFNHLLQPKAGGAGQVLYALGDKLDGCVDVTVIYDQTGPGEEPPTFWSLMCGTIPEITVHARMLALPAELLGRSFTDELEARLALKAWMTGIWGEKDALMARLRDGVEP